MELFSPESMPIYLRIAAWLEEQILSGALPEEQRIYSQYQLAEMFGVNPATAAKSLTLLFGEGTLTKKRGLGMFVALGAAQAIREKQKSQTLVAAVQALVRQAILLEVSEAELSRLIHKEMNKEATT